MIYACPPLADAHAAAHSASAAAIHICTVVHRLTSQRKPTYAARTHERGTTYYLNARLRSSSSCSLQLCSNSFDASRSARKSSRLTTIEHSSPSLRACGSSDVVCGSKPMRPTRQHCRGGRCFPHGMPEKHVSRCRTRESKLAPSSVGPLPVQLLSGEIRQIEVVVSPCLHLSDERRAPVTKRGRSSTRLWR